MTLLKKFKILALLLMASLVFAGCSKEDNKQASSTAQEPTADNPMIVDEAKKQIKVYAEVNDKFKKESTMHAIVAKSGKNN